MRFLLETLFIVLIMLGFYALLALLTSIVDAYPGFIAGVFFALIFGGLIWGLSLARRMVD